jgi:hypothetical protein
VADWVTISSLATAAGTLVLAAATFASTRSANRAARVAEMSLLANLRPLLVTSRHDDPVQKVPWADDHWDKLPGGSGVAVVTAEAIYLSISLRNVASGIAVLDGWRLQVPLVAGPADMPPLGEFRRLTRDLYIAPGDLGYWHSAFRDPSAPEFILAAETIQSRTPFMIDLLYGDEEGGQRMITRFAMRPRDDGTWVTAAARHWYVDRAGPRD